VALVSRLLLLSVIGWVVTLKDVLFTVDFAFIHHGFSGKDLILLGGGLFLLAKATHEIYENVERPDQHQPEDIDQAVKLEGKPVTKKLMALLLLQIMLLDIVFSLDSVITAVGMVGEVPIMVLAVLISIGIMIKFAGPVGDFVQRHASIRVLALAFLVLIGTVLVAEGLGQHISKGYIYFAMAFSLGMELVNMRLRSRLTRMKAEIKQAEVGADGPAS
jgi:predicted tellurium resistance membrane protein TerC